MDKKDEALKLALEALVDARVRPPHKQDSSKYEHAITAIREALAEQPARQEPVAWRWRMSDVHPNVWQHSANAHPNAIRREPLYTSPPASKPFVGLKDEEVKPLCDENHIIFGAYTVDFIQAIEAKLREKNA